MTAAGMIPADRLDRYRAAALLEELRRVRRREDEILRELAEMLRDRGRAPLLPPAAELRATKEWLERRPPRPIADLNPPTLAEMLAERRER